MLWACHCDRLVLGWYILNMLLSSHLIVNFLHCQEYSLGKSIISIVPKRLLLLLLLLFSPCYTKYAICCSHSPSILLFSFSLVYLFLIFFFINSRHNTIITHHRQCFTINSTCVVLWFIVCDKLLIFYAFSLNDAETFVFFFGAWRTDKKYEIKSMCDIRRYKMWQRLLKCVTHNIKRKKKWFDRHLSGFSCGLKWISQ